MTIRRIAAKLSKVLIDIIWWASGTLLAVLILSLIFFPEPQESDRFTPLVERMVSATATTVPVGMERYGAFHVDHLPCGVTLYLLPCRRGDVIAARAYIIDNDFSQIAELARDAKLAIREAAGEPLYTRLGRIVWRTLDLEITLYVGHRVIEIGTNDLRGDWR